jgi:2-keto-4-pentenoate hydratase/2-oxohepta-3-ene-1,7-dioic acid hydratase in catechol pathway
MLPFAPRSFRDFMLWERHVVEATRGLFRRFAPQLYAGIAAEEARSGAIPPQLRPKPLWFTRPIYYMGNHLSFRPEGAEIPWPVYTQFLDYELELGVVIARPVASPSPEEALAAIGGFVLVNDWSARDVQIPEMTEAQFGPVKAKHFASSIGAEVVTPDEVLPYVDGLAARVRVNGELWGEGSTAGMQHGLATMVAYAALGEQLEPGELLATGTIPGCCGVELDRWVVAGDVVELELERVGRLTNRVGHR